MGAANRVGLMLLGVLLCGCTSPREWICNGFKVGPDYCPPKVQTAPDWIDADDGRVASEPPDDGAWWRVFDDPVLDDLVWSAYRENPPLKEAGYRVLVARAQRAIAAGNLFPQQQQMYADFARNAASSTVTNQPVVERFFDTWDGGFNLAWELDFWGRLRRAITAADAQCDASIEDYDAVLVLLVADVARSYAEIRALQTQLSLARANVKLQEETLNLTEIRYKNGVVSNLDVQQAAANLAETESLIPPLKISLRHSCNQLCVLLGIPPEAIEQKLSPGPIPTAPASVCVGIPADLLRRRPDVRRAERELAAQSEQIGIAAAELYPQLSIVGSIGVASSQFTNLDDPRSFTGGVGPTLRWDILNYGRNLNRIRTQDAKFQELVWRYRNTVLVANQETENGLASFLYSQELVRSQARAVEALRKSVELSLIQYREGTVDFNRVFLLEGYLVQQELQLAQARANVVLGLIEVYRALGGGWQIRTADDSEPLELPVAPVPEPRVPAEEMPKPVEMPAS